MQLLANHFHARSARVMRRTVALVLLLAFGCSTTVSIQRPISQSSREQFERLLADRDALLTYAPSGAQPEKDVASDVTLVDEKVQWTLWESEQARSRGEPPGQRVEAPIDAVQSISFCDDSCRVKGLVGGIAFGAAAGLLLSAFVVSRGGHGEFDVSPLVWTAGPVVGAVIGTLVGRRGAPTTIKFEPPDTK
jgi:hypothetical protein